MLKGFERSRAMRTAFLTVFLILGITTAGQATPLDVELKPYPIMLAAFLNVNYVAATGAFSVSGLTTSLNTGTGQTSYLNRFRLDATISNAGVASGGTLAVTGYTSGASLLSSVSLLQFGYDRVSGGTLEFLYGAPSGSLVPGTFTGLSTEPVDVMLRGLGTAFLGSWTANWSTTGAVAEIRADPAPTATAVPEPSTLILMLAGAGGLFARRRRAGEPNHA